MAIQGATPDWAQGAHASDVTVGFFSWLEEVSQMWQAQELGERIWIPRPLLFLLFITAALLSIVASVCDLLALGVRDGLRARRDDRRAARLTRELDVFLARIASGAES